MKDRRDFASIIPTGYCGGCLLKIPTMGLVGKVGVNGWVLSKVPTMGLVGKVGVNI